MTITVKDVQDDLLCSLAHRYRRGESGILYLEEHGEFHRVNIYLEDANSVSAKPIRQTYRVELSDHDRGLLQQIINNGQGLGSSVIPKQGQYTATWMPLKSFTVNHAGETPGID